MKVILREHVEHLGEPGEVVTVAAGYARNYLLPKRLALKATPGNLTQIEHQRRVWVAQENKEVTEAEAMARDLERVELSMTMKAGETGTLYGSVTNADVAALLAAKGFEIDRKRIEIDHIKSLGSYDIPIKLHRKVRCEVKLEVVPEETAG